VGGFVTGLTMLIGRGAVARMAADAADVHAGDHVVDIGCGPGTAAREASRRGADVTGVDPAPVMLRLARMLARGATSIRWTEGAAEHLPVTDGSVSVVWSIATVHHWRDLTAGLAEARRVLKPGGRFVAVERRTRPEARGLASHGWTDTQATAFADRCRSAGFADVAVETSPPGRRGQFVVRARAL